MFLSAIAKLRKTPAQRMFRHTDASTKLLLNLRGFAKLSHEWQNLHAAASRIHMC